MRDKSKIRGCDFGFVFHVIQLLHITFTQQTWVAFTNYNETYAKTGLKFGPSLI